MTVVTAAFQVREARPADIEQLCTFANEFITTLNARSNVEKVRKFFERVLGSKDLGVVVVAEQRAELCGYAYAAFLWRTEFGETMELITLFTAESSRKRGVGRNLVAALVEIAKERNIQWISAEVRPENSAIERTLESCGFDPERRTLWAMRP